MKRLLLFCTVLYFCSLLFGLSYTVKTKAGKSKFEYEVMNNEVTIVSLISTTTENIYIPREIRGIPVVRIGEHSFSSKYNIKSIEIPDSVIEIEKAAFSSCYNLRKIELPSGLKKINESLFSGCRDLNEIYLPETVEEIKKDAFVRCESIRYLRIPQSIKEIEGNPFMWCKRLEYFELNENPIYAVLDGVLFEKSTKKLISYPLDHAIRNEVKFFNLEYKIPEGIREIGERAFSDSKIRSVIFPNTLEIIGEGAFSFSENLESVKFNKTLKEIKPYAFSGCKQLSYVNFPYKAETDESAFANCDKIYIKCESGSVEEKWAKEHHVRCEYTNGPDWLMN